MPRKLPAPEKAEEGPRFGQDTSARFALDQALRKRGFKIRARPPKGGEPVWELNGVLFSEHDAVRRLDAGDVEDAHYASQLYWWEREGYPEEEREAA